MNTLTEADLAPIDDRLQPHPGIYTKEGWWERAGATTATAPGTLTAAEIDALDDGQRRAYNQQRVAYFSESVIATPGLTEAQRRVVALLKTPEQGPGVARGGLLIDARASAGKTTILTHIAGQVERECRQTYGGYVRTAAGAMFTPTVMAAIPARPTSLGVARGLANYLGLDLHPRVTEENLTAAVIDALTASCTVLLALDELNNLSSSNSVHRDIVNLIKRFQNSLPGVVFLLSGIDLSTTGVLPSGRSIALDTAQIATRMSVVRIYPYDRDSDDFLRLLAAFEARLSLAAQQGHALRDRAKYLHGRTRGLIGPLKRLVLAAYQDCLDNGDENLTMQNLRAVPDVAEFDGTGLEYQL